LRLKPVSADEAMNGRISGMLLSPSRSTPLVRASIRMLNALRANLLVRLEWTGMQSAIFMGRR
jgi:hypothetical protein